VDEVNFQGVATGQLWSFTTVLPLPDQASGPIPSNLADSVRVNVDLSWMPGQYAVGHDVYLSRSGEPLSYRDNVLDPEYDPGILEPRTEHKWRIDEVNATGKTIGIVWTFTTGNFPGDFDSHANHISPRWI
jgi:hypothetical protein